MPQLFAKNCMPAAARNMRLPIVVVMAKPSREVSMPETSLRRRPGDGQGGTGRTTVEGGRQPVYARSIGSSTNTVYWRGRPRLASSGSTYMIELCPRMARGRMETRMKLVGASGAPAA